VCIVKKEGSRWVDPETGMRSLPFPSKQEIAKLPEEIQGLFQIKIVDHSDTYYTAFVDKLMERLDMLQLGDGGSDEHSPSDAKTARAGVQDQAALEALLKKHLSPLQDEVGRLRDEIALRDGRLHAMIAEIRARLLSPGLGPTATESQTSSAKATKPRKSMRGTSCASSRIATAAGRDTAAATSSAGSGTTAPAAADTSNVPPEGAASGVGAPSPDSARAFGAGAPSASTAGATSGAIVSALTDALESVVALEAENARLRSLVAGNARRSTK